MSGAAVSEPQSWNVLSIFFTLLGIAGAAVMAHPSYQRPIFVGVTPDAIVADVMADALPAKFHEYQDQEQI